jgi:dihydrofolate synthase / folylpolyglutamate synthase
MWTGCDASVTVAAAAVSWLETLPPWPLDGFGTERMRALLERLGNPERRFDAVHVVGTNGKSTATRRIARTIGGPAYTSPHVSGWHERLDTDPDGFARAVARIRADAEAVGATQFEAVTAAAFVDFADRADVAAIEAGLGGRNDATNVIDARVVLLTNVALEHTNVLGDTREAIAREKLAVAAPRSVVVLPDEEFSPLVPANEVRLGGAREAAAEFLGSDVELADALLPGRLELRKKDDEIRDGAHTPEAVDWLLEQLPEPHDYVIVVSILGDKDADGILSRLAGAGSILVATTSSSNRARPVEDVAAAARRFFARVERETDPHAAVALAHRLGPRVLVTGSLYLLADLSADE